MDLIGGLHIMHPVVIAALTVINLILARAMIGKLEVVFNKPVKEAADGRSARFSYWHRQGSVIRQFIRKYEQNENKAGIYARASKKMKKSGYAGDMAAAIYLLIKFILCPSLSLAAFILNFPGFLEAAAMAVIVLVSLEAVLAARRRSIGMQLQRNIYKIYKYLHNQISSGVSVQNALKTVYEVIDDGYLKTVLTRLAARYELTLDIDASLKEFEGCFDVREAQTLCVALRQGIITGDNQELLARQEDIMFKKYFNYIQAETDGCKLRSMAVALIYTSIVVVMIAVPLFKDVSEAIGKIFIN